MLSLERPTLLVIAPHPDDEVIGCGGLISKIKAQGGKVYILFMTVGLSKDLSQGGRISSAKQRIREIEDVAQRLQFDEWRIAFNGDNYHLQLDQVPQKKLIHEIERGKKISLEVIQPDILAIPMLQDYNQDHRAVAQAALTACRPSP